MSNNNMKPILLSVAPGMFATLDRILLSYFDDAILSFLCFNIKNRSIVLT